MRRCQLQPAPSSELQAVKDRWPPRLRRTASLSFRHARSGCPLRILHPVQPCRRSPHRPRHRRPTPERVAETLGSRVAFSARCVSTEHQTWTITKHTHAPVLDRHRRSDPAPPPSTGCHRLATVLEEACRAGRFTPARARRGFRTSARSSPIGPCTVWSRLMAGRTAARVGQGRLRRRFALTWRPSWTALSILNSCLTIGRPGNLRLAGGNRRSVIVPVPRAVARHAARDCRCGAAS